MSLQWKPEYSVNVKLIDEQHKELLQTLSDLQDVKKTATDNGALEIAFSRLLSYTQYHFATEERYFVQFKYDGAEQHVAAHRLLLDKLIEFRRQFYEDGASVIDGLVAFVEQWFVAHDITMDKKYTKCFNDHGLF